MLVYRDGGQQLMCDGCYRVGDDYSILALEVDDCGLHLCMRNRPGVPLVEFDPACRERWDLHRAVRVDQTAV